MKPIGQIPSAYGPMLDVFHDPNSSPNPDDCYFHDFEDCMTIAGVHGKANREKCLAEFRIIKGNEKTGEGLVDFNIFLKNGGQKQKYEPLQKPTDPVYQRIPKTHGISGPVENWITLAMDVSSWYLRSDALLNIAIEGSFDESKKWSWPELTRDAFVSVSLQHLLTAALEHLAESEIDCIQAAALYALTLHPQWRQAGLNWLTPIKDTWFADWIRERPTYVRFARACRAFDSNSLPAWISGDLS